MSDDDGFPISLVTGLTPTFLRQTIPHVAGAEVGGDCYRTSVACLLGLDDPTLVPHFCHLGDDNWGWYVLARNWIRDEHGLDLAPTTFAQAQEHEVACIANVQSKNGPWNHAVVIHGDKVHDPSGLGTYTLADVTEDAVEAVAWPFDPAPEALVAQWLAAAAGVSEGAPE